MTPPLCVQCNSAPVKPKNRWFPVEQRGVRIIDGIRWSWYCGRRCNGQAMGESLRGGQAALAGARANQRKAHERMLRRLVAACKGLVDEQGRVEVKAFVKIVIAEQRRQYARGFGAGVDRERARHRRSVAA